jgi:LysM repeat protein
MADSISTGATRATSRGTSSLLTGRSSAKTWGGPGRSSSTASRSGPATPAAIQRTSTREEPASATSAAAVAGETAWRSSIRSSGRAPRSDWVRSMRTKLAAGWLIGTVRVCARMCSAIASGSGATPAHGARIAANPFGGRRHSERRSGVFPWPLGAVTRIGAAESKSAAMISCRAREISAVAIRGSSHSGSRRSGAGAIARVHRKNGARGLAVLAASAWLGCAWFENPERYTPAYHRVRAGETLQWIADGYGVDAARIAGANHLRDVEHVPVGMRLAIPGGARIVYRVQRGETLSQIAARYRVRDSSIAHVNRLGLSRDVRPGQRLVMPREATLPLPPPGSSYAAIRRSPPARAPEPAPAPPPVAAPPPKPRPDLAPARALLDRAVADYRAARFERAIERARESQQALAPLADLPAARELDARAAFVEGSALVARGDEARARQAFERVHAGDPDFDPPRGWLSPRIEQVYRSARSQ